MNSNTRRILSMYIALFNSFVSIAIILIVFQIENLNSNILIWIFSLGATIVISSLILLAQSLHNSSIENTTKNQITAEDNNGKESKSISHIQHIEINTKELIPDNYTSLEDFCGKFLSRLSNQLQLVQGIMYVRVNDNEFSYCSSYAFYSNQKPQPFKIGEGISGQVARNGKPLLIKNIPDNYFKVLSGLGEGKPHNLIVLPIESNNQIISVLEIASFIDLHIDINTLTDEISHSVGDILRNFIK